jgi:hypothetical protein
VDWIILAQYRLKRRAVLNIKEGKIINILNDFSRQTGNYGHTQFCILSSETESEGETDRQRCIT